MTGWLKLNDDQRKAVLDEAAQFSGIPPKVIEKDWWVTLTLKALFQSAYSEYMAFKGGTSLSKGWNLIARFSEDIDIALDPKAFGMAYVEAPAKRHVDKLKREGCKFTSTVLLKELEDQLYSLDIPKEILSIVAAPVPADRPDTDPQSLFVKYPSLYAPNEYIADEVKVEVSVRSMLIPVATVPIQSILYKVNPRPEYAETPFNVVVVEPRKTFLEKIFLLHEEFGKPDKAKIRTERMSRHLYDLVKMANTSAGADALADHELYNHLIQHREWYSRISWVDYDTLKHSTVSFLPGSDILADYASDYKTMQEEMIHEDSITFTELISALKLLQGRVRLKHEAKILDEIIQEAQLILKKSGTPKENGQYIESIVNYPIENGKSIGYRLTFFYENDNLIFENITISK